MKKVNLFSAVLVLIFSVAIILSGYLIGDAIKSNNASANSKNTYEDVKVLNITQVAAYLNMTEKEVDSIIEIEKNELANSGSFTGKMFPYFTIDEKTYFYKDEIDSWLQEVSSNHRYYDTKKGLMIQ